ncbi:TetR/AcrR family transcriptional regulator [Haematobacter massiliensis]|uniref:TetR/AcrR family transcriptional regulator n=2 Tax=Haematobacter massiliensis TaxID=195105 RepID=UPI0013F15D53|nr:TetR/AcrR family transcriptional regulator [Haematobacter massiliensis]
MDAGPYISGDAVEFIPRFALELIAGTQFRFCHQKRAPMNSPSKSPTQGRPVRRRGRPSSRADLLDKALELILERGVEGLSFDSLAQHSGISKSGVIYHFPNREELNRAVRAHVRQRYLQARHEATESLPDSKTKALMGWAISSLEKRSKLDEVSAKIMTSGIWDASEGREHHKERFSAMSKGAGFNRAALAYLAIEGLWFLDLAGFTPFETEERARVSALLLSVIDDPAFDHLDE